MTVLEVELKHRYDSGFELDVAMSMNAGRCALFGPSGSGKTSILKAIAGLLRSDHARIVVAGEIVDGDGLRRAPERRGVGFVFQDHLLFPHLTVEKNLVFGRPRTAKMRDEAFFRRVVGALDLGDLLRRRPHELSGGQSQRVALGRAILSRPRILLMDEPLASLDRALKRRVLDHLDRVTEEFDIPLLFVSHAQGDVLRLADEIVSLDDGRVVGQGPTAEVLEQEEREGRLNPLNLVEVTDVIEEKGVWRGRMGDQWVFFSTPPAPAGRPTYIRFGASDVTLARTRPDGLSIRNCIPARVERIVEPEGGGMVFVALEAGGRIWSEITPKARDELGLVPGAEVFCLLKTAALRTF